MYPMQKSIKNKIKCVPCIHVLKNQDNTRFKGKYNPPKIYLFLTHTITYLGVLFRQITTFIKVWPLVLWLQTL